MESGPGREESVVIPHVELHRAPALLTHLEPRGRAFWESLAAVLRRPDHGVFSSEQFWPDVFVNRRLPWSPFVQSAVLHAGGIALVWLLSMAWMRQHPLTARPKFDPASVTYYTQEEYLRPLDTGESRVQPQRGEPEYARQAIISVPPEPDNRTQTIVVPPDIKLAQVVRLPNVVSWPQTALAIPISATSSGSKVPALPVPVVAPPPEVNPSTGRQVSDLGQSVVAPAPNVDSATTRRYGDVNIGHAEIVAPAPQLPMAEQQAGVGRMQGALGAAPSAVVPPPPSVSGSGGSDAGSRLIALGLHPDVPTGPIEAPAGNRRGAFAITPQGHSGAPGTPDIAGNPTGQAASLGSDGGAGSGTNGTKSSSNGLPAGLHVGSAPESGMISNVGNAGIDGKADTGDPPAMASANAPRTGITPTTKTASPLPDEKVSELDREVFGPRRVYSMTLNMPNLNSSGGSWVIRFSELKEATQKGDLFAPEATHKVDPGYPIELIRQNVHGTVTLRAVIHSDGRVSDVKVLNSPDERLDRYAQAAFEHWQFRPALKNGTPIALEAVISIPFRIRNSF